MFSKCQLLAEKSATTINTRLVQRIIKDEKLFMFLKSNWSYYYFSPNFAIYE